MIKILNTLKNRLSNKTESRNTSSDLPPIPGVLESTPLVFPQYTPGIIHNPGRTEFGPQVKGLLLERFAALDFETTGLSRTEDRIIEIGCVIFDHGQEIDRFETLVNPHTWIPSAATRVNHITNEMVADAPDEKTALMNLKRFLEMRFDGKILLCAHNASFDYEFLKNGLERNQIPMDFAIVDTLKTFRTCLGFLENHKQKTIARYYGISEGTAHRAGDDASVCGRMLHTALMNGDLDEYQSKRSSTRNTSPEPDLEELLQAQKDREALNFTEDEKIILCFLTSRFQSLGMDITGLRAGKMSGGMVDFGCGSSSSVRFKQVQKGIYFLQYHKLVPETMLDLVKEDSKAERERGEHRRVRVFVRDIQDVDRLIPCLFEQVNAAVEWKKSHSFTSAQDSRWEKIRLIREAEITESDLAEYLQKAETAVFVPKPKVKEPKVKHERTRQSGNEPKKRTSSKPKEPAEKVQLSKADIPVVENASNNGKKRIRKMDDEGTVLEVFESINEASRTVGISSKSLRDAANGRQKHAAGYVWRFEEEGSQ